MADAKEKATVVEVQAWRISGANLVLLEDGTACPVLRGEYLVLNSIDEELNVKHGSYLQQIGLGEKPTAMLFLQRPCHDGGAHAGLEASS